METVSVLVMAEVDAEVEEFVEFFGIEELGYEIARDEFWDLIGAEEFAFQCAGAAEPISERGKLKVGFDCSSCFVVGLELGPIFHSRIIRVERGEKVAKMGVRRSGYLLGPKGRGICLVK